MIHVQSDGTKVTYSLPMHKGHGNQKVRNKTDTHGEGEAGAIGTWKNYGGWGAGASRERNTGRQVAFQRVEGKIRGVVKRDGCVVYA